MATFRWVEAVTFRKILVHCRDCCRQIDGSIQQGLPIEPIFFLNGYDYYDALCICFAIMRCVHGPRVAALHVWVALIVPGCVHVGLRFAVGVGSSGVCTFHVLILMSILVLNLCGALD